MQHEQIAEDDFDVWVELRVVSDYFSCAQCGLVLEGVELVAAEMPDEFEAQGDAADYVEAEYGNE